VRLTGGGADTLIYQSASLFRTRDSTTYRFEPASGAVQRVVRTSPDGFATTFEMMRRPELSAAQLSEFAGEYHSPELRAIVRIRADSGRLYLRPSPDEEVILVPLYPDGFRVGPSPNTVRFVRRGGRITELRVFAGRARNVLFEKDKRPTDRG
jgi:hypothetical protein